MLSAWPFLRTVTSVPSLSFCGHGSDPSVPVHRMPHLVAITTWSRRPLMALATTSSLAPMP